MPEYQVSWGWPQPGVTNFSPAAHRIFPLSPVFWNFMIMCHGIVGVFSSAHTQWTLSSWKHILQVREVFLNYFFDDFYSSIFPVFSPRNSYFSYVGLLDWPKGFLKSFISYFPSVFLLHILGDFLNFSFQSSYWVFNFSYPIFNF